MTTICLDAGHGGKDPGAILGKRYEKDDMLKLVKAVAKELKKDKNIRIVYTRTTDVFESVQKKAQDANAYDADYFFSFHRNASTNKKAKGFEAYVYRIPTDSALYAVHNYVAKDMFRFGFTKRGLKAKPKLAVLNKTKMPAILFELGFISNKEDNALFDEHFKDIAKSIAQAIRLYIA